MSHRPVSVLRNNSMISHSRPQSRVGFSLPRQKSGSEVVRISQVECGSSIVPKRCLNFCCPPERCNHAKLASPQVFVTVLIALLILHGATEGYLVEVLPTIILRFHIPIKAGEWILVSHKLSQVLVGILIAHTAGANRPKRLGGYIAIFAVSCCTLISTHLVHGDIRVNTVENQKGPKLCHASAVDFVISSTNNDDNCWVMFALLLIFQFLAGMSYTALMSHGITYIDDNIGKVNSPAYIGAAFGVGYIGRKLGSLLGWICLEIPLSEGTTSTTSVLGSWWLGWPYLSVFLLLGALIISLFPNLMPSTAVKHAAKKILCRLREEVARTSSCGVNENNEESFENKNECILSDLSLLSTLKRLLKNRMIVTSLIASIFLEAALGNFLAFEPTYLESVYQIPKQGTLQRHGMQMDGFEDPWMSRLITGMLKAPLIAMTLIVSGLLLSRIKPKASTIAAWAASMAIFAAIITAIFLVMICPSKIKSEIDGRLELEHLCNFQCHCNEIGTNKMLHTNFNPVCSQDGTETFYSPCHAGCKSSNQIHGIQVFRNCSCISDTRKNEARLGACISGNSIQCRFGWIFFQGSLALIQILIASGMVGKLILCLRCVLPQDKPMVFGLELTCVYFFAYVPFKLLYDYLKDLSCMSWTESGICQMHESSKLALSINVLTSVKPVKYGTSWEWLKRITFAVLFYTGSVFFTGFNVFAQIVLLFISAFFTIWMSIIARNLDLYEPDDDIESYHDSGYDEINDSGGVTLRESRYGTPWPSRKKRGKRAIDDDNSQQSGLLQMIVSPAPPSRAVVVDNAFPNASPSEETGVTEL